ncbi:MAG: AIR synthase related protein, partial [Thermofilum sp.]
MEVGKLGLSRLRPLLERAGVRAELDANEVEGFLVTVNPAVGVPDELLGFFAFHYSASNIAAAFGKPEYSLLDLTLPPGYPPEKAELILSTFIEECRKYGVKLVGGHTGRYEGVEYPLASSTMLGRRLRPRLAPEEGDRVYLLGKVGSEAAWLAGAQVELEELTPLPKALKLAEIGGVKLAHDVSEGGLLGALLEVSAFYRRVIEVDRGSVPVEERAPRVSEPLALPSYGALIAVGDATVRRDAASLGLECYEIGRVLSEGTGVVVDGALVQEAPISEVVALYAPGVAGKGELAAVALAAERF